MFTDALYRIVRLVRERRKCIHVEQPDRSAGRCSGKRGMVMRKWIVVGLIVLAALVSTLIARSFQSPAIRAVDEAILREYAGTYQWDRNAFVYLQIWPELTGTNQLVAFDETGELRILYPSAPDRFFTGRSLLQRRRPARWHSDPPSTAGDRLHGQPDQRPQSAFERVR